MSMKNSSPARVSVNDTNASALAATPRTARRGASVRNNPIASGAPMASSTGAAKRSESGEVSAAASAAGLAGAPGASGHDDPTRGAALPGAGEAPLQGATPAEPPIMPSSSRT